MFHVTAHDILQAAFLKTQQVYAMQTGKQDSTTTCTIGGKCASACWGPVVAITGHGPSWDITLLQVQPALPWALQSISAKLSAGEYTQRGYPEALSHVLH